MAENYNMNITLDEILNRAWRLLEIGSLNRESSFHCPVISSIKKDDYPTSRTVVLRDVDPKKRILRFHTDRRSSKIVDFKENPNIAFLFYDAPSKIQIRLEGSVSIHLNDEIALNAWAKSQRNSKICYAAPHAPGTTIKKLLLAPSPKADEIDESIINFCVILSKISKLEWLYLSSAGHHRALFDWTSEITCKASWLAP